MDYDVKAEQGAAPPVVTDMGGSDRLGQALDRLRLELKQDLEQGLEQGLAGVGRRMAAAQAPMLSGAGRPGSGSGAFADLYLRKGLEQGFEVKRFASGTAADGGLAVPLELDARIEATLAAASPIRQIATVVRVGTTNYRKLVAIGGFQSGWVGESVARPETATPSFAEVAPSMGELYANPAATQTLLDDAFFDVEAWLAEEIGAEFARAEGVSFVAGTGTAQPRGFVTYPVAVTGDAARPWGTLQYVPSGAAGAFAASNPADRLVDLVQSLRTPYRQGAVFVMNGNTLGQIRKFKDSTGAFLWQPAMAAGQPGTLLGYPVIEADAMPDLAGNSLSVAFGNFRSGYVVAERGETAVLRDPYSNKPFVHFYATRRVGGAVANFEAIKLMRFSAS